MRACHLRQDPWIAWSEVPTYVATSHDTAGHGSHRAGSKCLARGKDSEAQVKLFYEFGRRKGLDGGAVTERCRFVMERGSPQISGAATMRM